MKILSVRALAERRAPEGQASPQRPTRLGDRAGILVNKTLVVAIEERTCLTLVFRLREREGRVLGVAEP